MYWDSEISCGRWAWTSNLPLSSYVSQHYVLIGSSRRFRLPFTLPSLAASMQLHRSCEITKSVMMQNRFQSLAKFKLQRIKDGNRSTLQGFVGLVTWAWAIMPGPLIDTATSFPRAAECQLSHVLNNDLGLSVFKGILSNISSSFQLKPRKLWFFTPPFMSKKPGAINLLIYSNIAPPDSPQFHWQPWGVIFRPRALQLDFAMQL